MSLPATFERVMRLNDPDTRFPVSAMGQGDALAPDGGGVQGNAVRYELQHMPHRYEDIVLCVDADREVDSEMRTQGVKGGGMTRLEVVKQALLLFVHAKLAINPKHRFAFLRLSHQATWHQHEFTNDIDVITNSVKTLTSDGLSLRCNLTSLLRTVAAEAKTCHSLGRILRVVLVYCRSSVVPEMTMPWPENQRLFTFDVMYLHDKPSRDNCPQKVYDALVDALERVSEHDGYIYESGSGLARLLFKNMCMLLAHPQQRCGQDDFHVPRDLSRVVPPSDIPVGGPPTRKEDSEQLILPPSA